MRNRVNQNNSCIVFKLDQVMKKQNMSKNRLSRLSGFRFETIQGYYEGSISRVDLFVMSEFCRILNCKVEDIIEYNPELSKK